MAVSASLPWVPDVARRQNAINRVRGAWANRGLSNSSMAAGAETAAVAAQDRADWQERQAINQQNIQNALSMYSMDAARYLQELALVADAQKANLRKPQDLNLFPYLQNYKPWSIYQPTQGYAPMGDPVEGQSGTPNPGETMRRYNVPAGLQTNTQVQIANLERYRAAQLRLQAQAQADARAARARAESASEVPDFQKALALGMQLKAAGMKSRSELLKALDGAFPNLGIWASVQAQNQDTEGGRLAYVFGWRKRGSTKSGKAGNIDLSTVQQGTPGVRSAWYGAVLPMLRTLGHDVESFIGYGTPEEKASANRAYETAMIADFLRSGTSPAPLATAPSGVKGYATPLHRVNILEGLESERKRRSKKEK